MWISEEVRGAMLLPKIWICVGVVCLLCQKIEGQCSKPVLNENAVLHEDNIQQNSFPENSSVRLSCVPGYTPASGLRKLDCQAGEWNPNPQDFTCKKKSCGNPGEVRNGVYNMSEGIEFGAIITTICSVGHFLVGDGRRTCQSDGIWSGRQSVCEVVKCGDPPNIENGGLETTAEEYLYNQVVVYVCNADYNLIGNNQARCSENGSWTEAPRCKKVECQRPEIPNAVRVMGNSGPYGKGSTLEYKCNEGFTMVGEPRIVCGLNGWSPTPPKCEVFMPTTDKTTPQTPVKETSPPTVFMPTTAKTTPQTPVKETTLPTVSPSSPAKTTPRTSAKVTSTTEDGRNGAPLVHSSLWIVLATLVAVAAQNSPFSLIH